MLKRAWWRAARPRLKSARVTRSGAERDAGVEPQLKQWANDRAFVLHSPMCDRPQSRSFWLVSDIGECFQIAVDPLSGGVATLRVACVEGRRGGQPAFELNAAADDLRVGLEAALDVALEWMRPARSYDSI